MKKIITLCTALIFATVLLQGQILVQWTFPTGNATDSIADGGIGANLNKAIHTEGGTSAIDFTKNGNTTKAAQATGWDNGTNVKCWVVNLTTLGYDNIKISSKMQSGGNNPGPRDYKVQYRIGTAGTWTDAPGTTIVTANDWSTGVLDSVVLPSECNNQSALYLRWIMTSNTNSSGANVGANGINKIDDIYVSGQVVLSASDKAKVDIGLKVSPNPSNGKMVVETNDPMAFWSLYSVSGKCLIKQTTSSLKKVTINIDSVPNGTYFLKVKTISGKEGTQKVVKY